MKVVGLITEYNPFHNGHKFHIEEARRITGADYVIAVMSGDFVQRGTPAIIDKYSRTRMALSNGVDLVLELPVCYATGSAEFFAHGAVSILNSLGVVDYLCFGSEAGDIELLQKAAELMRNTPASFDELLKAYIKEGLNYPAARQKALEAVTDTLSLDSNQPNDNKALFQVLAEPNNILGIEYLKAIRNLSASMQPVTIRREAAHYHEATLTIDSSDLKSLSNLSSDQTDTQSVISSATAIRSAINMIDIRSKDDLEKIKSSVPIEVYQILSEQYLRTFPITEEDFATIIKYKLLCEDTDSLLKYLDISSDLADRMKNITDLNLSIAELSNKIKTKNMTLTRISRSLIHLLLGILTEDMASYKSNGYASYARILGIKKNASVLMRSIQKNSRVPVITKVAKADKILDDIGLRMLSGDIFATHLYNQTIYEKYRTGLTDEYRHGIVIM